MHFTTFELQGESPLPGICLRSNPALPAITGSWPPISTTHLSDAGLHCLRIGCPHQRPQPASAPESATHKLARVPLFKKNVQNAFKPYTSTLEHFNLQIQSLWLVQASIINS